MISGERAAFFSIVLFSFIFLVLTDLIKFKFKILILITLIFSLISVITFSEKIRLRFLDQTIYAFYGGKNYSTQEGKDSALKIAKSKKQLVIFTHDTHAHYVSAYRMFLDNKFFGKGVKMFRKLCSKKEFEYDEWSCTSHPHNTYLQLLAETGIFGFLLIFTIFILCLVEIIKIFFKKIFNKKYSVDNVNICLYGFFIIYLWPLMPTGNFFNNWLSIILFFTSGFFLYRNNKINFNES